MTKSSALSVTLRRSAGLAVVVRDWADVSVDELQAAVPWRTFRWRHGQKHFSGAYWSSTQRDVVIYESRLELARLLFADFEPSVVGIVAQPFLLKTEVKAKQRRHIPDYLFVTHQGPVVVDVQPPRRLADPTTVSTFEMAVRRRVNPQVSRDDRCRRTREPTRTCRFSRKVAESHG